MAATSEAAPGAASSGILAHPLRLAFALCILWVGVGLIGHDPWRREEAQNFGIVFELLRTGDWVIPALAGEPFVDNPPLLHLTAAAFARAAQALLPLHEGARLASGLYASLALLLVAATWRELHGPGRSWLAALALLGSVGMLLPGHLLVPDIAQLAGVALALYGLALTLRRALLGGLALGAGVGICFLAKGLVGPVCLALTAALLPVLSERWRTRAYAGALLAATVAALPWLLIWPLLLAQRAPELFQQWFWANNVARLWTFDEPGFYLGVLPWFAFPCLPLAAWALWVERRGLAAPPVLLPAVLAAVLVVVLSLGESPRESAALPVLAPLAVLAAAGVLQLRRDAANACWWFTALFGSFLVLMGWFEWFALEVGVPAARHRHWLRLQPGYTPQIDALVVAAAIALTVFWFWFVRRLRRSPERPLLAWATAMAVAWAMGFTMFADYVNAGKSYRRVAMQIARELPAGHECVSSYNLGTAQRAMFHYFAGVLTYREGVPGRSRDCDVLLVQGQRANIYVPGPQWTQRWEGMQRGDRRELFRLYERTD
jgi:4-amino-4-deoxy-L-arabinose transferase-like glycosyltransferase